MLVTLFRNWSYFKGLKIGVTKREFGVIVGQLLLIYGEVIYNKVTKMTRVDSPLYFLRDKKHLINSLKKEIRRSKLFLFVVFGPVFFISTGVLIRKLIVAWRRFLQKRRAQQLAYEGQVKEVSVDGLVCVVCKINPRNVLLKPCYHFNICRGCFEKESARRCRNCKKRVTDSLNIYVA